MNFFQKYRFDKWQKCNIFYDKSISIMGDSISTLINYNPEGYDVFYKDDICNKSRVYEMKDTWWGKVIDFFGLKLLVNNSWSGSRVSGENAQSGCSEKRTANLHLQNEIPDIIIIYLGFNDFANGVPIYSLGTRVLANNKTVFDEAYEIMLNRISMNYPGSKIYCCTLPTTFMSKNENFEFPYEYGGINIEKYNKTIKQVAESEGCIVLDLYNYNLPYDTIDGTHPNREGMITIAKLVCSEMIGKKKSIFDMYFDFKK